MTKAELDDYVNDLNLKETEDKIAYYVNVVLYNYVVWRTNGAEATMFKVIGPVDSDGNVTSA